MIRRLVALAGQGDGAVGRVVVDAIALVQCAVLRRLPGVAKGVVDQREIVMGRGILGIDGQRVVELLGRLFEKLPAAFGRGALLFRAFDQRLAEFVKQNVVLREIEVALVELGIAIVRRCCGSSRSPCRGRPPAC